MSQTRVPTRIEDLDTPALLIDLDVMERNLQRVADYAAEHKLRLRPHTKTHKSISVARRQLALGAAGLTVAKTSEAEVMLGAEPRDLLVAYPVMGAPKVRRLASLARVTKVTVAIDNIEAAKDLSGAGETAGVKIGVLTEIEVGAARVGTPPTDALDFARAVRALPGIEWRGFTFYPGHLKDPDDDASVAGLSRTVEHVRGKFVQAGMTPEIVSGGSTPLLFRSHEIEGANEIRPGTYVFNDMNTVSTNACTLDDCAGSVLVTVVSHAADDRMIVDGGSKTFSSDKLSSGGPGHGRLTSAPGAYFHKMNEEHGFIDLSKAERSFSIGEKVRIIPNHVCVVVNLHEYVYGVRKGVVEDVWSVDARGKLQ